MLQLWTLSIPGTLWGKKVGTDVIWVRICRHLPHWRAQLYPAAWSVQWCWNTLGYDWKDTQVRHLNRWKLQSCSTWLTGDMEAAEEAAYRITPKAFWSVKREQKVNLNYQEVETQSLEAVGKWRKGLIMETNFIFTELPQRPSPTSLIM